MKNGEAADCISMDDMSGRAKRGYRYFPFVVGVGVAAEVQAYSSRSGTNKTASSLRTSSAIWPLVLVNAFSKLAILSTWC